MPTDEHKDAKKVTKKQNYIQQLFKFKEGIAISKTPHMRPIKQGSTQQCYQLTHQTLHILKSMTILFLLQCHIKHKRRGSIYLMKHYQPNSSRKKMKIK